ncbi:MAG: c-type cytochrome [Deltaproteobacteria bacterium]|nr:c-type cytochrome [Deltaproteobacteria bacterium]
MSDERAAWKTRVRERYEQLKKLGRPFFPDIIAKDAIAATVLFCVLIALAHFVGVELAGVADPTDTTYNPRPEWYFLFLFQALKFFPGAWEPVAAIILPTLCLVFLFCLPWIDRGPNRHPFDRPILTLLGIGAVAGFVTLTVLGMSSPLLNPVVQQDPTIAAGKQLYDALRCNYCHSINGRGGLLAPDLSTVGARRDGVWLAQHFTDPQQATPGSLMPRMHLLPEEVATLAAYMQSLGGEGPFSAQAPARFAEHCGSCHRLDGQGGDLGPDLSTVHTYRDKAYLLQYLSDPTALNKSATMPGFRDTLSAAELEDLARYLLSTQRQVAQ